MFPCTYIDRASGRARDERGQATAEYGVVILVAIALGTAVLMLFTGGAMNDLLGTLLKKVLSVAGGMIHA